MSDELDVIADTIGRIRALCAPAVQVSIDWQKIEAEARQHWGGDRHYIPVNGEAAKASMGDRDARIRAERSAGRSVPELQRRFRLSRTRIWQILLDRSACDLG